MTSRKLNILNAVVSAALIAGNAWAIIFVYVPKDVKNYTALTWSGVTVSILALVVCGMSLKESLWLLRRTKTN